MTFAFCVFLFVIGLGIYLFHSQYIIHFLLIWFCFGPVFFNLFYTIEQKEYYNILTWAIYLGYAIFFLDYIRFGITGKWQKTIVLCVIGLIIYYVSLSFVRGTSFVDSLKYITGNVGFLLPLSILLNKDCNIRSLVRYIRVIVYAELLLALLQPFSDLLNFHAALNGDDVMTTMVNGTFVRNNVYIEFLTPLVMLLIYIEYKQRKQISFRSILIILILLYETYNTGVRTALVAMLPILIYMFYHLLGFIYKTPRSRIFAMLIFGLSMYSIYSFINSLAADTGVTYTKYATNSSERQTVLLSMLNDPDFAEDQTTLGLSFVVLSTLADNPIIGSGKLFQGSGYGGFISKEEGNITDATLAIFLCETGILGLLLLLYIYYVIIYKMNKPNLLPKLLFIYLFMVSISDSGVFFMGNMLVLFIAKIVTDKSLILK